jgi:CheY-like chemotaxis protein
LKLIVVRVARIVRAMRTRVLVVDDDRFTCNVVRRLLEDRGYGVTTVESARDASKLCDSDVFDILVCDIDLRCGGNGNDVMRELAAKCNIKGIAYTALTGVDDIARMSEAGFEGYVFKPASIKALLEAIERLAPACGEQIRNGDREYLC